MEINAFLIIVAVILIGCVLLGCKKGFVHTVFTMFSLLIVSLLTGLLSPYVGDYVTNHTDIPKSIRNSVEQQIKLKDRVNINESARINEYIDKIDLPEQLRDVIKEKSKKAGDAVAATTAEAANQMIGNIYDRITELIISAIAYVFTFAVVLVIVIVAGLLLDIVAKLPGIKQANTVLGGIIGFVQGYLIVSLLYIIAMAFAATKLGTSVIEMVDNSSVLTWFYEHNIVVNIVFGMLR